LSGIRYTIPTTFTDTTLPVAVHSVGIDGYSHRYVAKALPGMEGLTEGNDVATWPSLGTITSPLTPSGNTSGTDAPLFRANSGNPYVEFDGVDDGLGIAGYASDSAKTVVMVMRRTGGSGTPVVLSGSTLILSRGGSLTLSGNTGGIPSVSITSAAWHVVTVVSNGNGSFTVVDGVKSSQTPANVTGKMSVFRLGREASSYGAFDLAEVIAYSDAKSEADIATIRAALQAGYPTLGI
jgi:hypothetical protein